MTLQEITVALFATCNSLRIAAYFPQMLKAATDKNGASSISLTTWFLFLVANLSTVAYALVNRSDWGLAACFAGNAICSAAILVITYCKRRSHARRWHDAESIGPAFEKTQPASIHQTLTGETRACDIVHLVPDEAFRFRELRRLTLRTP